MLGLQPDSVPYYYGRITRENAEHILWDRGCIDGMYLLRASNNFGSDYVLSLCRNNQIFHYRIEKDIDDLYFLCGAPEEKYHGPIELIQNIGVLVGKLLIPCLKPLNVFMPGVNCGITDEKLKDTLLRKSKDWGVEETQLQLLLEDKDSDVWKLVLKSLHETEVWFHGRIGRAEAERRLTQHGIKDGHFLVREHDEHSFTLSLGYSEMVKHYKIDVLSSGEVAIRDGPRFENIISLVSHYSVFNDGLWCTLGHPCPNSASEETLIWPSPNIYPNSSEADDSKISDSLPSVLSNPNPAMISPIAANRTGSISTDIQHNAKKGLKMSSKPKSNTYSKSSIGKSNVAVWLKNPVAFLTRNIREAKASHKAAKSEPQKNAEDSSSGLLVKTCATENIPISSPITKKAGLTNCSAGAMESMPAITDIPVSDTTVSSPEHSDISEDINHNYWSECEPYDTNYCHPDGIVTSSLSIATNDASKEILFPVPCVKLTFPICENVPTRIKTRPAPLPRKNKMQLTVGIVSIDRESAFPKKMISPTSPRFFENPKHSTSNISPLSNFQINLKEPELEMAQLIHPCEHPLALVADMTAKTEDMDSESIEVTKCLSKLPMQMSPASVDLASMILELKQHHIMKAVNPTSIQVSSLFAKEDDIASISQLDFDAPIVIKSDCCGHTKEQSPSNDIVKSGNEAACECEPQYEEIDPEYDNSNSTSFACAHKLLEDEEVCSQGAVISLIIAESKWDDNNKECNDNRSSTGTPVEYADSINGKHEGDQQKPPWTKEQSDFHYKTIKRHHRRPASIDRKYLSFKGKIGIGNFGHVMKATFKSGEDEVPCAVKMLKHDKCVNGKGEICAEAHMMMKLDHQHIVRLLGISEGKPFLLIMELAPLGSMNGYLKHHPNVLVADIIVLMHQVALGMEYLESKQFVHRDLAARNVLLVNDNFAKISDFGMSKALGLHSEYYMVEPKGRLPLKWYAPECIYFFKFSTKSDVWSYGITLWEAFSYGGKPYLGMTGREILNMFSTGDRLSCPEKCPADVYKLMWSCWEIRPERRPSFSNITSLMKAYVKKENATTMTR